MSSLVKRLYLFIIFIFLYAPIAVLIIFSFNESKSRAHWTGFTLDWYFQLFKDPNILSAIYTTLAIAVLSALISTAIGTIAALGINNMGKLEKRAMLTINNLPVLNPDIVTGVSLMVLFIFIFKIIGFGSLGFVTLLTAHVVFNIPYVLLSVLPKLRQLDKHLYEAAVDLGATPSYAFRKVILPEIMPGIITGAMLAFTLSIDDFVISFFTTGSGVNNLSTIIYSMARRGVNPKINALSTIMFLVVLVLLFFINKRDTAKGDR